MDRRTRLVVVRLALLMLCPTAVPSAAAEANPCVDGGGLYPVAAIDGIGGTEPRDVPAPDSEAAQGRQAVATDDGIGGTGISGDDPDEGGIGGTGVEARGDIGVFGVVTGFASICVGGTEIEYDETTPLVGQFGAVADVDLAIGQVVSVVATRGRADVRAREIEIRDLVRGRIASVDWDANRIEALGQVIQLGESTWTGDAAAPQRAAAADFSVGDVVRVSGLRRSDGVVEASLVARLADTDQAWLTGPITDDAANSFAVSGVRVEVDPDSLSALPRGEEIAVSGEWDGAAIRSPNIRPASAGRLAARVEQLQIEGYLLSPPGGGELRIGGARLRLGAGVAGATGLVTGARVRVEARSGTGAPVIERVFPTLRGRVAPESRGDVPPLREGVLTGGADHHGSAVRLESGSSPAGQSNAPAQSAAERRLAPRPPADRSPPQSADGASRRDRPPPVDRAVRPELPQRPERPNPPDRPERPVRPERPERPERPPRPDRPDLPPRLR